MPRPESISGKLLWKDYGGYVRPFVEGYANGPYRAASYPIDDLFHREGGIPGQFAHYIQQAPPSAAHKDPLLNTCWHIQITPGKEGNGKNDIAIGEGSRDGEPRWHKIDEWLPAHDNEKRDQVIYKVKGKNRFLKPDWELIDKSKEGSLRRTKQTFSDVKEDGLPTTAVKKKNLLDCIRHSGPQIVFSDMEP